MKKIDDENRRLESMERFAIKINAHKNKYSTSVKNIENTNSSMDGGDTLNLSSRIKENSMHFYNTNRVEIFNQSISEKSRSTQNTKMNFH